jgi:hypothetical protein
VGLSTSSHNTNDCNYVRRQEQSALNDGHLTLGDWQKMKLDADPFLVNVNLINFEEKKRTEPRVRMLSHQTNLEPKC